MTDINDAPTFQTHVLCRFFADMHRYEGLDNYDQARFSHDGVDRSKHVNGEMHVEMLKLFNKHFAEFFAAYALLEDEASKALFIDLIRFRMAGHLHVRLPTNTPAFHARDRLIDTIKTSPSHIPLRSVYGPLKHCVFEFGGQSWQIDSSPEGITSAFFHDQYYFDRDGVRIAPQAGDHLIDGGSFMGDNALRFSQTVGESGHVYTFDPMPNHIKACRHNFAQNPRHSEITCFCAGLSDRVFDAPPQTDESEVVDPGFSDIANGQFSLTTIDHLVQTGAIARVDFIKMDVEGSEMRALKGAEACLRRFKPRLALSIYHYPLHFFQLVLFLDSLKLGYRFYVDHYTIHAEESVLYAYVP